MKNSIWIECQNGCIYKIKGDCMPIALLKFWQFRENALFSSQLGAYICTVPSQQVLKIDVQLSSFYEWSYKKPLKRLIYKLQGNFMTTASLIFGLFRQMLSLFSSELVAYVCTASSKQGVKIDTSLALKRVIFGWKYLFYSLIYIVKINFMPNALSIFWQSRENVFLFSF